MERESMAFDVVIVGGGPAGLSAAIRLRQLDPGCSVCLIDKGAQIGAHILSGAIVDPHALAELFPDWQARNAPLDTPVTDDRHLLLTAGGSLRIPKPLVPKPLRNAGLYIVSLGELCRWLAKEAEALGVEIYPGFAGKELLHDEAGAVRGVLAGGMELLGRCTLLAEGCRGHLGKRIEAAFGLRETSAPQTYSLGIKELWEVMPERHAPGLAIHTAGWPLDCCLGLRAKGGGFIYHHGENRVSVGLVADLGCRDPFFSPFDEMQRLKTHPALRGTFEGGRRIGYGARALTTGGLSALPRLVFPGGALIGDDAGFLVAGRQKGIHAAMKSGMLAAEAIAGRGTLEAYPARFRGSWLHEELRASRSRRPAGRMKPAAESTPAVPCRPDGTLTFDKASSLALSGVHHAPGQPCHLRLKDTAITIYGAPETYYCPAGVYEIVRDPDPRLHVAAENCLHCKACDIRDPGGNIEWTPPRGGDGPLYSGM